jgi:hypothetical protein
MTLKLKADPTYFAKVEIPTPNGPVEIKAEYKHMPRDEYLAFVDDMTKAFGVADTTSKRTDEEILMRIMVGWANVDAEFSRDTVHELCQQYHAAAGALVEGYIRSLTQGRLGN